MWPSHIAQHPPPVRSVGPCFLSSLPSLCLSGSILSAAWPWSPLVPRSGMTAVAGVSMTPVMADPRLPCDLCPMPSVSSTGASFYLPKLGLCLLYSSTGDRVPGRWSGAESSSLTPCRTTGDSGRPSPQVGIMKTSTSIVQHRQLSPSGECGASLSPHQAVVGR